MSALGSLSFVPTRAHTESHAFLAQAAVFTALVHILTHSKHLVCYTMCFRTNTGDKVACRCNYQGHSDGSVERGRPMRGRTHPEAGSQRNDSSQFDQLMHLYLDPSHSMDHADLLGQPRYDDDREHHMLNLVLYTVKHILTECPLTASLRESILHNASLNHIFSTKDGSASLALFLHHSQLLLQPLLP